MLKVPIEEAHGLIIRNEVKGQLLIFPASFHLAKVPRSFCLGAVRAFQTGEGEPVKEASSLHQPPPESLRNTTYTWSPPAVRVEKQDLEFGMQAEHSKLPSVQSLPLKIAALLTCEIQPQKLPSVPEE